MPFEKSKLLLKVILSTLNGKTPFVRCDSRTYFVEAEGAKYSLIYSFLSLFSTSFIWRALASSSFMVPVLLSLLKFLKALFEFQFNFDFRNEFLMFF